MVECRPASARNSNDDAAVVVALRPQELAAPRGIGARPKVDFGRAEAVAITSGDSRQRKSGRTALAAGSWLGGCSNMRAGTLRREMVAC